MSRLEDDKDIRCSFCGKTQDSVKRIIAGPGVYICNECIGLCANIIEDELREKGIQDGDTVRIFDIEFDYYD